jgi:hypothetical protein
LAARIRRHCPRVANLGREISKGQDDGDGSNDLSNGSPILNAHAGPFFHRRIEFDDLPCPTSLSFCARILGQWSLFNKGTPRCMDRGDVPRLVRAGTALTRRARAGSSQWAQPPR